MTQSKSPEDPFGLLAFAEQVAMNSLSADAAAGIGRGLVGPENSQQMLMHLQQDPLDSAPDPQDRRRRSTEYVALPTDPEALQQRGMEFLNRLGLPLEGGFIQVLYTDDLMEIRITDPTDPRLIAQTSLLVSRKGEAVAEVLGEYLREVNVALLIAKPSLLMGLEETGFNIEGTIQQSLEEGVKPMFDFRDHFEISDDQDSFSTSGAMHIMETVSEVCTTPHIKFALPIIAIATNVRWKWPYRGALKESILLTDGVPEGYKNFAEVADASPRRAKILLERLDTLRDKVREQLVKKRDMSSPVDLEEDDVYIDSSGNIYVLALSFDAQRLDEIEYLDDGYEDEDDDDDSGDQLIKT